jgi:hypothetical protein
LQLGTSFAFSVQADPADGDWLAVGLAVGVAVAVAGAVGLGAGAGEERVGLGDGELVAGTETVSRSTGTLEPYSVDRNRASSSVAVELTWYAYVPAPATVPVTSKLTVVVVDVGCTVDTTALGRGWLSWVNVDSVQPVPATGAIATVLGRWWESRVALIVACVTVAPTGSVPTLNLRNDTIVSPLTRPAFNLVAVPKLVAGRAVEVKASSLGLTVTVWVVPAANAVPPKPPSPAPAAAAASGSRATSAIRRCPRGRWILVDTVWSLLAVAPTDEGDGRPGDTGKVGSVRYDAGWPAVAGEVQLVRGQWRR